MKPETTTWLKQAQEHWQDATYLYHGSRYSMSVYCCHQTLEKILKAAIIEFTNTPPPKSHKLDQLANQSKLNMPPEWSEDLAEITRHFWRVRYPDFQQYTYTNKQKIEPTYTKTQEIYTWILNQFNQK